MRNLVAAHILSQADLDRWLLQEPDPIRRQAMFRHIQPMLKFSAVFPSVLAQAKPIEAPRIIVP